MRTGCKSDQLEFEGIERRRIVAAFDGGAMTSDAGALLLRHTDKAIGLFDRVASCFEDHRSPDQVVHTVRAMVGQRIAGIALGYEDINDHDELRHDPVLGLLAERLAPARAGCAALANDSPSIATHPFPWTAADSAPRKVEFGTPRLASGHGGSCTTSEGGEVFSDFTRGYSRTDLPCASRLRFSAGSGGGLGTPS